MNARSAVCIATAPSCGEIRYNGAKQTGLRRLLTLVGKKEFLHVLKTLQKCQQSSNAIWLNVAIMSQQMLFYSRIKIKYSVFSFFNSIVTFFHLKLEIFIWIPIFIITESR